MPLQPSVKRHLPSVLALLGATAFLGIRFEIVRSLRPTSVSKEVVVENVSASQRTVVQLFAITQTYRNLPLTEGMGPGWTFEKPNGSEAPLLTSRRPGDRLQLSIPVAGSTQFIFAKSPEAGLVRVSDLETGQVFDLDLGARSRRRVSASTESGTKRAWELFIVALLTLVAAVTLAEVAQHGWRAGLRCWADPGRMPVAYGVVGITLLLCNLLMTHRLFHFGDSLGYWESARTFVHDGRFSLANLDTAVSFRGYVLPLLAFVAQSLGEALAVEAALVLVLLTAALYLLFFALAVPHAVRRLSGSEARPYQVLAVFALTGFFWFGWFTWLLSDLLAACAWIAGLTLLPGGREERQWFHRFLAGGLLAIAINCRPNYKVGLVVCLAMIGHAALRRGAEPMAARLRAFGRDTALVLLGLLLVSWPQARTNWTRFRAASPFPFTSSNPRPRGLEAHGSFVEYALAYGRLRTQGWPSPYRANRIGTSVLQRHFGVDPGALDDYEAAEALLKEHGGMSVPLYLDLVREYPLEFAVDFFLKVFTGLNNQSCEPYPVSWRAGPSVALFAFLNYCVLFPALLIVGLKVADWLRGHRGDGGTALWYCATVVPALVYVPLFVEWRYFLPVYMASYLLLVTTRATTYSRLLRERSLPIWYVLFILTCFALSALVSPEFLH